MASIVTLSFLCSVFLLKQLEGSYAKDIKITGILHDITASSKKSNLLVILYLNYKNMIQNVDFKGIVRGTSAQNNADGNCEEIINLRKKMGAWRVAGEKKKIVENVGYEQVFLHEYNTVKNYIGVKKITETGQDPTGAPVIVIKNKVIWFNPVTGKEKVIIEDATGEIVLNQLNNILLIKNDVTIIKAVFDQGNYKVAVTTIPEIPRVSLASDVKKISSSETLSFSIAHASHVRCGRDIYNEENTDEKDQIEGNNALLDNNGWPAFTFQYKDVGIKDFAEAVRGLFNMRINSEKGYVYGYVFVSVAYQLYDDLLQNQHLLHSYS